MSANVEMNALLSQMREMRSVALKDVFEPEVVTTEKAQASQFGQMFRTAIDKVNNLQQTAGQLQESYIRGEGDIDISRVMVASQKSSLAFQAAVQVRNRLLEAYKDVMNMPV